MNRATLVERIADLVNEKVLTDITAIRDESDENTRVVIELKRDANPKVVINNLYKHTAMESSFAVNMLAIDHGRPKLLPLKEANPGLHRSSPRSCSCAGPALNCAKPRSARRRSKVISSRWRIWMNSSASFAAQPIATKHG